MKIGLEELDKFIDLNTPKVILTTNLIVESEKLSNVHYRNFLLNNIMYNVGIMQDIPSAYFTDNSKYTETEKEKSDQKSILFNSTKYELNNTNLVIENSLDNPIMKFNDFKNKCMKLKEDKNIKVIGIEALYFTFLRTCKVITIKQLANLAKALDIVFIVEFEPQYDFLSYYNKNMPAYMAETYNLVKNSDIVIAPFFNYLDSTILLFVSIKGDKDSKVFKLKYDKNINKIIN